MLMMSQYDHTSDSENILTELIFFIFFFVKPLTLLIFNINVFC